MTETALGHRLDHHVDVATVVEVAVADHDGVELGQVDLALGVLDDRARPRIEAHARVPILYVEAARRRELLGDHETRTGRAHERDFHELTSPPCGEVGPAHWRGPGGARPRGASLLVARRSSARKTPPPPRARRSPPQAFCPGCRRRPESAGRYRPHRRPQCELKPTPP